MHCATCNLLHTKYSYIQSSVHGTAPDYLSDWVGYVDKTTLLVLDSARQHTVISRFHVPRPTLVVVRLQSPGQRHGTDYQQQSAYLTLCRISRTNWKLPFLTDRFFFSIHLECGCPWIGLHVAATKKLMDWIVIIDNSNIINNNYYSAYGACYHGEEKSCWAQKLFANPLHCVGGCRMPPCKPHFLFTFALEVIHRCRASQMH